MVLGNSQNEIYELINKFSLLMLLGRTLIPILCKYLTPAVRQIRKHALYPALNMTIIIAKQVPPSPSPI